MARGYSLIELAVVLAVVSVLMAMVAPDFIEMTRNRLAEKATKDVVALQDAAKWYYHQSSTSNPALARWPGQNVASTCQVDANTARANLTSEGYVTAANFMNPWSQPYIFSAQFGGTCNLRIATQVPEQIRGVLSAYLPGARCVTAADAGCPYNPNPGNAFCCSNINEPGYEAALAAFKPEVMADTCDKLGGVWSGTQCNDMSISETRHNCSNNCGLCPPGKVMVAVIQIDSPRCARCNCWYKGGCCGWVVQDLYTCCGLQNR